MLVRGAAVAEGARAVDDLLAPLDATRRIEGSSPRVQRASDLGKPTCNQCVNEQALEHLRRQVSGPRVQRPSCSCRGCAGMRSVAACAGSVAPARKRRLGQRSAGPVDRAGQFAASFDAVMADADPASACSEARMPSAKASTSEQASLSATAMTVNCPA